jgi:outer membrane protein assembly factor BamB
MTQKTLTPDPAIAPLDRRTFISTAAAAAALAAFPSPREATAKPAGDSGGTAAQATYYGAPDPNVPKVGLRWAFSATVFFADRVMINSPAPRGYTSVGGGEVWGPRLQGRVLPASGADYYKTTFNTYYMYEASDGALIFIHNRGTMRRFQAPYETGKPLVPATNSGPPAPGSPPVWTRFRATPVFTAPDGPHAWMNNTVFVANCQRQDNPDHTVFTYYEVL